MMRLSRRIRGSRSRSLYMTGLRHLRPVSTTARHISHQWLRHVAAAACISVVIQGILTPGTVSTRAPLARFRSRLGMIITGRRFRSVTTVAGGHHGILDHHRGCYLRIDRVRRPDGFGRCFADPWAGSGHRPHMICRSTAINCVKEVERDVARGVVCPQSDGRTHQGWKCRAACLQADAQAACKAAKRVDIRQLRAVPPHALALIFGTIALLFGAALWLYNDLGRARLSRTSGIGPPDDASR